MIKIFNKNIIVFLYKFVQKIIINLALFNNNKNDKLKIYFGGALKGDKGGPLVKVKRLKTFFND